MSTELIRRDDTALAPMSDSAFMPVLSMDQAVTRYKVLVDYVQKLMVKDKDFGTIPGTNKPCLYKPGAEKLGTLFGLTPQFTVADKVEDWTGAEHGGEAFFYYSYRCTLYRGDRLMADADGSCNSWESKYRYRWAKEDDLPFGANPDRLKKRSGTISEYKFAIDKAETSGKYGKPPEYWQKFKDAIKAGAKPFDKPMGRDQTRPAYAIESTEYRIPNEDIASQINTIQKMAQKRAFVAAILIGVNASEFFTQDLEDLDPATIDIVPLSVVDTPKPQQARGPEPSEPEGLFDDAPQPQAPKPVAVSKQKHEPVSNTGDIPVDNSVFVDGEDCQPGQIKALWAIAYKLWTKEEASVELHKLLKEVAQIDSLKQLSRNGAGLFITHLESKMAP